MNQTDFLAARAFVCETCMTNEQCPADGGCASMWCTCRCNTDPEGSYAPQVTADASFGPGHCYWCGGALEASACMTCGREPAPAPSFTSAQLRARVARGRNAA